MLKSTRGRALAVPTVLSLALGGALLAAVPASAAPNAFSVTNPVAGSTVDNTAAPTKVTFDGQGLPAADHLVVTYDNGSGTAETATITAPVTDGTGAWTTDATLSNLDAGVTSVAATVTPLDASNAVDPAATAVTRTFSLKVAPTPAPVVSQPFSVATPSQTVASPTATPAFTGTGTAGDTVTVTYTGTAGSTETAGSATVDNTGAFTIATTDFSKLPQGVSSILVHVTETGTAPATAVRRLVFAAAPVKGEAQVTLTPVIQSVQYGSTVGIAVDASGFAGGEQVAITVENEDGSGSPFAIDPSSLTTDDSGNLVATITFPKSKPGGLYAVTITGATSKTIASGVGVLIADPTITSPTQGEALTGSTITFAGRGTPGSNIVLVYGDPKEISQILADTVAAMKTPATGARVAPKASSPSAPADQAAPIVVGQDGTWSVTYKAAPGAYSVLAQGVLLDPNGVPAADENGNLIETGIAGPVSFTLAATVTTAADGSPTTLAFTGSNDGPYLAAGGLLLVVGAGLVVASRRRRTLAE
ncbi:hypothetical protein AS850_13085 [Frondihabitans sp. 762G35]|uniref:LPXTG cell wall anchor domain-containing protein n=1 Tax=Frondihabitans sp. 762G35 TaxID=1446794 RepID=UPI000D22C055|nr:LPXTG cell wall anchor domain-containing protein [Frondihabitans sp. 762G35]ARC58012.1 hypothetical protein AS850_13085 [Frondihabitans sp. 762G35]